MYCQLPSTLIGMSRVVSRTITSEMPSIPTRYEMPQSGIQGAFETSCSVPREGSSAHQSPRESTNSTTVTRRAVHLADDSGPRSTGTTPSSGSRTRAWRIHCPEPMESRNSVIGSPDHGAQDPERANEEEHHVHPDLSRLEPAPQPAEPA